MKNPIDCLKRVLATAGLFMLLTMNSSCNFDWLFGPPKPDGQVSFLILHNNEEGKIGRGSYMSIATIEQNEAELDKIDIYVDQGGTGGNQFFYPPDGSYALRDNVDVTGDKIAMRLHTHFNYIHPAPAGSHTLASRGVLIDTEPESYVWLPMVPAARPDYEFTNLEGFPRIGESGQVAYASGWNDRLYGDTWYARSVRYDPVSDDYIAAHDPVDFCLGQPGVTLSTKALANPDCFLSPDGKYLYGTVSSFAWVGGSGGEECRIIYQYDIAKGSYTRLGELSEKLVKIHGWTSNKEAIYYFDKTNNLYKLLDLEDYSIQTISAQPPSLVPPLMYCRNQWNENGYVIHWGYNAILYMNLRANRKTEIATPAQAFFPQFAPDGTGIYFMLKSTTANYLCKTDGLTETATIDTLCDFPVSVREFLVIGNEE